MVIREVNPEVISEAIPEVTSEGTLSLIGQTASALSRDAGAGACQTADAADALLAHAAALAASVPDQIGATIVHGDYRLDNCMLGADGSVVAVLDWEICTLGDPLADLGLLCVYWTDPDGPAVLPQASPTALDGFPRAADLVARYAEVSGRDVSQLGYYVAFGYWKLTCIIAGVYARYAGGAMGSVPEEQVAGFRSMLDALAEMSSAAADEMGRT